MAEKTPLSSIDLPFGRISLFCEDPGTWSFSLSGETAADGASVVRISLESPAPARPPRFSVGTDVPLLGAAFQWRLNDVSPVMRPEWAGRTDSSLAYNAPLHAFFGTDGDSAFCAASSECARFLGFRGGVREEGTRLVAGFSFFEEPEAPLARYETLLRFDVRKRPLWETVPEASRWMLDAAGIAACKVPDAAFEPLYSSWYCFHQNVGDADLEKELGLASSLGMRTVIVDDGWQTDDNNRGYAFCGDWQVSRRRFPDMRAHVAKAHALGMKYMLWYSVPFVGFKSANYARFKGKFLVEDVRGLNAAVLDPRFPEVRRFLIDTYLSALREWDLDGFKLDFIDSFRCGAGGDPAEKDGWAGRDIPSVPAAVDRLLEEVHSALVAEKPDILVEFRQSYDGPAIRKYGNMFRVADCPGDWLTNRVAIANMRLALPGAAVHSDMLEWNFAEPPEKAALFVLNSIFGVIQYSVMLREAPPRHLDMVRHWVDFSRRHRKTLLFGALRPRHPESLYPVVEAESDDETIVGAYAAGFAAPANVRAKPAIVLNATGAASLLVETDAPASVRLFDTFGADAGSLALPSAGIHRIRCPEGGFAAFGS